MLPPPRNLVDISIIHSIKQLYIVIYQTGKKLSKSDKLSIHADCQKIAREIMRQIITASFSPTNKKLEILKDARVSLEVLKHFIRTEHELQIINEKTYIRIETLVVETSKMTNGWIKYIQNLPQQKIPT